MTGWVWADPQVAIVLAINVVREGWLLLRSAVGGLMDQVDDEILDAIESALFVGDTQPGDVVIHFDPCDASLCRHCRMPDCPIREAPFEQAFVFDRERLTREDAASHGAGESIQVPAIRGLGAR